METTSPERLAHYLLKKVNKACHTYSLLTDGDRIAVAVSGGKDSNTLLDLLHRRRGVERCHLVAVHVSLVSEGCQATVDLEELERWLKELGVEYTFVPLEPATGQPRRENQSPCFHCAWRRRKALFLTAQRLGCNKVALGHNADDVAQTTLLNLVYHGRLETMAARVDFFAGKITVIRPLYLVPEKEIIRYVQAGGVPVIAGPCPVATDSRRTEMAKVLRLLEQQNPRVKIALLRAVERFNEKVPGT
ncbi:MAG: tRNA 2-thiocytidine biosynthesis TtcA family protein [Anaerolineae bacterium]|jgi:tRNA 2-thiocytidine biosynthesis protein TtcA|nr:tRNA 2-thiocytidine biosynthesis TtcA family protein [Anaerolineae bacterium]MDH7474766.1 tRNA 2-thiocytidine biosynthesis TtcA family protein [Anaerolineae bacterium]